MVYSHRRTTGAEIGVAAVGGGDQIHAELQGYRHAASEAFRSVHGEEQITAAVEGEELVWRKDEEKGALLLQPVGNGA